METASALLPANKGIGIEEITKAVQEHREYLEKNNLREEHRRVLRKDELTAIILDKVRSQNYEER